MLIKKIYHPRKLVRDKIPDKIIKRGGKVKIIHLYNKNFKKHLLRKMKEELKEFKKSSDKWELADMYEVLITLASIHGISVKELEECAEIKRKENGGFIERKFLAYYSEIRSLKPEMEESVIDEFDYLFKNNSFEEDEFYES